MRTATDSWLRRNGMMREDATGVEGKKFEMGKSLDPADLKEN